MKNVSFKNLRANLFLYLFLCSLLFLESGCRNSSGTESGSQFLTLSKEKLMDKIKGAWAAQTIGVTYGGPTEFRYLKRTIPDSVEITWSDTTLYYWMANVPGLYDDVYMDLTFVEVIEKEGLDAPASSHAQAYSEAKYWLWHANQQGRFNVLNGLTPPETGHWLNNPHADDIDFQIEADFAGIMTPGMPAAALEICDRVGHIMNYGDGYYGGVFVAGMYSHAFVIDDISEIINKGLSMIPEESTFHKCIADVIRWHREYPEDWRTNWEMIEEKWGWDLGCPDGAFRDFNIDAKINAAYVVLGLLYGEGDFGKTLEISTRAGQDSDCNPATAGAILGTIMGYSELPSFWIQGLESIEDVEFRYTTTSLNDVYEISFRHALEMIERNAGEITEKNVKIMLQKPKEAPLEQSFPGYALGDEIPIDSMIFNTIDDEFEIGFEGTGVVLLGNVKNVEFQDKYALISDEETLDGFELMVEFYIDEELTKTMKLPLYFIERAHELFFQYEIPEGEHTLKMKILNPNEKVYVDMVKLITYKREI